MTRLLAIAMLLVAGCASSRPIAAHSANEPVSTLSLDSAAMGTLPEWVRVPEWAQALDDERAIDADCQPVATIRSMIAYVDGHANDAASAELELNGGDHAVITESRVNRLMAQVEERDGSSLLSSPRVSLFPGQKAMAAVLSDQSGTVMFLKTGQIMDGKCVFDFSIQCLDAMKQPVPSDANRPWELAGHADLAVGQWYQRVQIGDESGPTVVVLVGLERIAYPDAIQAQQHNSDRPLMKNATAAMLAVVDPSMRTPPGEVQP